MREYSWAQNIRASWIMPAPTFCLKIGFLVCGSHLRRPVSASRSNTGLRDVWICSRISLKAASAVTPGARVQTIAFLDGCTSGETFIDATSGAIALYGWLAVPFTL